MRQNDMQAIFVGGREEMWIKILRQRGVRGWWACLFWFVFGKLGMPAMIFERFGSVRLKGNVP